MFRYVKTKLMILNIIWSCSSQWITALSLQSGVQSLTIRVDCTRWTESTAWKDATVRWKVVTIYMEWKRFYRLRNWKGKNHQQRLLYNVFGTFEEQNRWVWFLQYNAKYSEYGLNLHPQLNHITTMVSKIRKYMPIINKWPSMEGLLRNKIKIFNLSCV